MFNANDYAVLSAIVFRDNYPGYTPSVIESPNGDGAYDEGKKYAHVKHDDSVDSIIPVIYFNKALNLAVSAAIDLGLPRELWPSKEHSCLRVLEYPPGVGSAGHTDFDLFTVNLYRNFPGYLKTGIGHRKDIHYGELLEAFYPRSKATHHCVDPHPTMYQYSLVFFAMPDYTLKLPSGQTVEAWVEERKARSRKKI